MSHCESPTPLPLLVQAAMQRKSYQAQQSQPCPCHCDGLEARSHSAAGHLGWQTFGCPGQRAGEPCLQSRTCCHESP